MSTRAYRSRPTDGNCFGPRLLGRRGAVTAEHYLSAQAGADLLKAGGNAVDAAVGAVLVEGVVNPQMHTLGGECPLLIAMAGSGRVVAVNGNTMAPGAATPEAYRARGLDDVPDEGILAAGVPAAFGALLAALSAFGRLPFAAVASPALALARDGFPAHCGLIGQDNYGLRDLQAKLLARWPGSAKVYLPGDTAPREGDVVRNPALAAVLEHLIRIEAMAGGGRVGKLRAVYAGFYRGDVAAEIDRYSRERDGLLARADLERFETRLEAPATLDFHDVAVHKCGFWNQGPAMLQALAILERVDLARMGHNGADYLHWLIEAIKLAYADREQFYGDPRVIDVPFAGLLSKDYAAKRRALIDPQRASRAMRPGDPRGGGALLPEAQRLGGKAWGAGTVHVDVIDVDGNVVAATPSGGWLRGNEVVPALGFPLGNRLMTFYLAPAHHPNLVAPFKQPRTTISPSLVSRGGQPWMAFGSMGGDQQDQWQLQFLLNRVLFGMTVQQAIEAPKLSSEHFPGFFAPHDFFLGRVRIEERVGKPVIDALVARGHEVETAPDWTEGYLLAAARDPATGLIEAGADPRGTKSEVFPAFALCW